MAHRLFSSVTNGRKKAPRELKELGDALFGLCYALDHLRKEHETIVARATLESEIVSAQVNQHLVYMIKSCRETLEELDNATAKYREAADDPPRIAPHSQERVGGVIFAPQFRAQFRIQWKRILWDIRGDTLTKYRQKLQVHTDSINLLLSTFIWSVLLCVPFFLHK
ncbi:hypothetical protein N7474_001841 [Penicillium riverlandense]|uniref:uncharacterized protein n=1 Tax=Penicillium riverlandense TaxID=1903569 RepID=UPI0025472DC1|nr:uncharacterized protein N7474_001841 [Penicillium riverlandense]KAJ5833530.1 hypothetical protein N7474_001841 [Penicillium riverlandense]